jgi:ABC-type microcin C transport system permease subunit YejB
VKSGVWEFVAITTINIAAAIATSSHTTANFDFIHSLILLIFYAECSSFITQKEED